MDELGFDRETVARVSNVPQRTVAISQIGRVVGLPRVSLTNTYRFYLRKCIRDEAVTLGHTVLKRFEELAKDADFMTTLNIANAVMMLALRIENGE